MVCIDSDSFDEEADWENEPGEWVGIEFHLVFDMESQNLRPRETGDPAQLIFFYYFFYIVFKGYFDLTVTLANQQCS